MFVSTFKKILGEKKTLESLHSFSIQSFNRFKILHVSYAYVDNFM